MALASPNYTPGRARPIRCVVIHTMEVPETGSVAEAVGRAFANPATKASAHVGVDTDSTCRYVADMDTAWAAPGANADGLQLELAGRAGQTTGDWADTASKAILERAAQQTASWCRAYGIQARRLTDAQLADGKSVGIVGHADVSRVFKRSDHWDPGPAFPWGPFLARVGAILGYPTAPPPPPVTAPRKATMLLIKGDKDDKVFITDGMTRRHVGPGEVKDLLRMTERPIMVIAQGVCDRIPVQTVGK